jgi:plasmid stabilization system protein ParE
VDEDFEIVWAPSAIRDLDDILEYVSADRGTEAPEKLYLDIIERVATLSRLPRRARVVPELKQVGVQEYRELIWTSYRIPFAISGKVVALLGVFDGRRDLNELLLKRALDPLPFE